MGLFDFPRIHFSGKININVPTINNSFYFPLTIYDQTRSRGFQPPRLYFSSPKALQGIKNPIPNLKIYPPDKSNNPYCYIEIEPINTPEILKEWCMVPIGSYPKDTQYYEYYQAADADLGQNQYYTTIWGCCPGYWNMWGDMSVSMQSVEVTGVQTFNGTAVTTWTQQSSNIPADIATLLQARFDMDSSPGNGHSTACMVETISSQSVYASIFCDKVNLYNSTTKQLLFQGRPTRFGALLYGSWRVVNWVPPMASSGRFCATVPLNEMSQEEQNMLLDFFGSQKGYDSRPLQGVFISFTIFEVFENRYDQQYYAKNGKKPNPAQATTVGSITPWYEGDMQTGLLGRNLISLGESPMCTNPAINAPIYMTPAVSSLKVLQNNLAIFSVDMGNSWPETMTPQFNPNTNPPVMPARRGDASFETANIGTLAFQYGTDSSMQFASISINPTDNPRTSLFQTGCLFDFVLTDATLIQNIQNNLIGGYLTTNGVSNQVLIESTYMICSDQKGLYADRGDNPSDGYRVNTHQKEPCRIRIFQKGVPVTQPVTIMIGEYVVPEAENDAIGPPNKLPAQNLIDNAIVSLSPSKLTIEDNAIYYFIYDGQYGGNNFPIFFTAGYSIMDTGAFVALRVHPSRDYSKYIDPSNPDYTPPTFAIIYQEIFSMYDIAYPVMGDIYPFKEEVWNNPTVARAVLQYTDPKMWSSIQYMPRSRELSTSQFKLLRAWANYIINQNQQ